MSGFQLFIDIAPIAFVALMTSFVMILRYRKEPAAQALLWYLCLVCFLLAANCAELIAPAGPMTLLFAKVEYVAFLYIPVAWLSFSLRYTEWIRKTRKSAVILAAILPFAALALVFLNDWHHLMWTKIAYFESEGFSVLRAEHGPLFWAVWTYSWIMLGSGTVLVFRAHFSGQRLYHRQSLWILAGMLMPGLANTLYVFRIGPGPVKDFTPIGYALSGFCFIAGMYIHRMLWIMPVTRGVILQELRQGILVIDRHGWIVDHNNAAETLCGIGNITVGSFAASYPALRRLFADSGYEPGIRVAEFKTGEIACDGKTISWSMQPANGAASGVLYTLEDITQQSALRSDMDKIKNEFINQEKLAVVGRLTAGLAHEVNNPLGYLKSDVRSLELLIRREFANRDDKNAAEILEIANGITSGLDRIENVIKTLLSFSRQGKVDAPFVEYSLEEGIDTALEIMKHELRGIAEVRKEYAQTKPLMARKNEINQVIFNILSNAVRAIKDRSGTEGFKGRITIRTGSTETGAWCEIGNNGPAIGEEARRRLFELFFTTKPEQIGHGLGLNLSREIIEIRHKGRLTLVSAAPVIFRIELPYGAPA